MYPRFATFVPSSNGFQRNPLRSDHEEAAPFKHKRPCETRQKKGLISG